MKEKGQIYLVRGSAGEYSSYSEWTVAAFTEEERANLLAEVCRRKVRAAREAYEDAYRSAAEQSAGLQRREHFDKVSSTWLIPEPETPIHWPRQEDFSFPEDPQAEMEPDTSYDVEAVSLNPEVPNV